MRSPLVVVVAAVVVVVVMTISYQSLAMVETRTSSLEASSNSANVFEIWTFLF